MSYPTTAHTLLDNIEANLRGVRARVGDRQVLAAVKANAYGHGAAAVAAMIERCGHGPPAARVDRIEQIVELEPVPTGFVQKSSC